MSKRTEERPGERTPTARRAATAVAIAAVGVLVSSCGAGGTVTQVKAEGSSNGSASASSIAASDVRAALGTTDDLDSGRMEIVMTFTGPESGGMHTTVEFNGEDARSSMTYEGEMFDSAGDVEGLGSMFSGPMETIFVDGVSYTRGGMNTFFGADPDTWITFGSMDEVFGDLGFESDEFSDELGGAMGGGQAADLDQYGSLLTEMLGGVESDFELVGPEDVRGETLDHYRMVLTAEEFGAIENATGAEIRNQDWVGGATFDVWLDADGLTRKVLIVAGEGDSAVDISMELYDLGADVEIAAPENAEAVNIEDMFGGFEDAFLGGEN